MDIDLQKIREIARDSKDLHGHINAIFAKCLEEKDPPLLSDLIANFNQGGVFVMEALGHKYKQDRDMPPESRFHWKLYVKRDEWGNGPNPDDVIMRRIQKPLEYGPGKPVPSNVLSIQKKTGQYDKLWHRYIPYKQDKKGCLTCEFQDAVHFLRCWGIHPRTGHGGEPLSMHMREKTGDPDSRKDDKHYDDGRVIAPSGEKLRVWYWRYIEMDKEGYAKLPKLEKRTEPRRGYAE
jgi:hypothetical protein